MVIFIPLTELTELGNYFFVLEHQMLGDFVSEMNETSVNCWSYLFIQILFRNNLQRGQEGHHPSFAPFVHMLRLLPDVEKLWDLSHNSHFAILIKACDLADVSIEITINIQWKRLFLQKFRKSKRKKVDEYVEVCTVKVPIFAFLKTESEYSIVQSISNSCSRDTLVYYIPVFLILVYTVWQI